MAVGLGEALRVAGRSGREGKLLEQVVSLSDALGVKALLGVAEAEADIKTMEWRHLLLLLLMPLVSRRRA